MTCKEKIHNASRSSKYEVSMVPAEEAGGSSHVWAIGDVPLNRIWFLPLRFWHREYKSAFLSRAGYTFCPFRLQNTVGVSLRFSFFTQTRHFRKTASHSTELGIYFHHFVWKKVAQLYLFSLEQGQVPRHSATHPHTKLRGVPPPPGVDVSGFSGKVRKSPTKSVWLLVASTQYLLTPI